MVHKHVAEFILRASGKKKKLRPFDPGTSLVSLFQRNDPKLGYKCFGKGTLKAESLNREQFEPTYAAVRLKLNKLEVAHPLSYCSSIIVTFAKNMF